MFVGFVMDGSKKKYNEYLKVLLNIFIHCFKEVGQPSPV